MNRAIRNSLLFAVAVAIVSGVGLDNAEAGGWGWAKPLNKRGGAFYTSNRNINNSYGIKAQNWRRQNSYQSSSYSQGAYRTPTYHAPVVVHQPVITTYAQPVTVAPVYTEPARTVVHSPPPATIQPAPVNQGAVTQTPLTQGAVTSQPPMTTQMAIERWTGQ